MTDHESQSSSGLSDEEGWLDANPGDDEEPQVVISLLDDRVFPDAVAMLAYCKDERGFDFLSIRDRLDLDFYGCVRLINFIRQRVHEGLPVSDYISASEFDHDKYLKPVLDDDALIFCLDSLPVGTQQKQQSGPLEEASLGEKSSVNDASPPSDMRKRNGELQSELESLTKQFENYRLAVQQTLDRRWGVSENQGEPNTGSPLPNDAAKRKDNSDYYFESYSHNDIHETMLKDTVRTDAYRDFIYGNKHLFAGKIVLDIGCGTGILSMFCAKAGAKLVIAVDRSDIIDKARENVFNNGLGDQITCLKGTIEETKLPVDKVDIIVSEWMGYGLLYEAMLPSVLYARDKYLKPDGLLVPSHAALWIAPVCDSEFICDSITFWRDVYGFDMKAMQTGIYDDARVLVMPEQSICGSPCMFRHLDLHNITVADLVFNANWKTLLSKEAESLDAFTIWFDIYFAESRNEQIIPIDASAQGWIASGKDRVAFSTGPFSKETHWRQCLMLVKSRLDLINPPGGRELSGDISFSIPSDNPRGLTLAATWTKSQEPTSSEGHKQTQSWELK